MKSHSLFPQKNLLLVVIALFAGALFSAAAENIIFPSNSSVKNVITSFGAKGDGIADDSQPLQNA